MIQAVIFDMDGLLIDSEPLWKEAEIEVFGTVGIDLTSKGCEASVGLRIDEVVDFWYQQQPWTNKTRLAVVEEIVEVMHRLIMEKGQAKKGVDHVMEFFNRKNIPCAIATSSYRSLMRAVIRKFQLKDQIMAAHSAELEDFGKPHPAVFLTCAEKLSISPKNCLVFEDSFNGVLSAKAARMKTVAVPEKSHDYDQRLIIADHIISDLGAFNEDIWQDVNDKRSELRKNVKYD